MQKVSNLISENFLKVNIFDGVNRILNEFRENNVECFAACENENLVGVITNKELVGINPNRIVADVMTSEYECIDYDAPIWRTKEIFDCNSKINVIFAKKGNKIIGFVSRTILMIEFGKHIDLLTGLYKNDYIFYNAHKLVKWNEISTIFIDLNNFGQINKIYGHTNGDTILKIIAKILKENISADTYLSRFGGDEFIVLTPWCIDKSKILAEKLINKIEKYNFPNAMPVSVSIGITGCKILNNKIENIITFLDKTINLASLASTRAKKNNDSSIDMHFINITEIA